MIKGILFDVDGVLIDSEWLLQNAYINSFAKRGLAVGHGVFEAVVGTSDEYTISYCAKAAGGKVDIQEIKNDIYDVEYPKAIKGVLKPFPGVYEFIGNAKKAGLKLALATSGEIKKLRSSMAEINYDLSNFDFVATRDMVENAKPAPDLYIKAAQGLGLAFDECLVFEDAYNGLLSGKSAGCRCLGLTSSFPRDVLYENGAEVVLDSMSEIPAFSTVEEFNSIFERLVQEKKDEKSSCSK